MFFSKESKIPPNIFFSFRAFHKNIDSLDISFGFSYLTGGMTKAYVFDRQLEQIIFPDLRDAKTRL